MTKETEFLETIITLVWNNISKQELVEMLKDRKEALEQQLTIPVVVKSLPSKEESNLNKEEYATDVQKTIHRTMCKGSYKIGWEHCFDWLKQKLIE